MKVPENGGYMDMMKNFIIILRVRPGIPISRSAERLVALILTPMKLKLGVGRQLGSADKCYVIRHMK